MTATGLAAPALAQSPLNPTQESLTLDISVDLRRVVGPLDHIWSRCAGSDRAAMTLRESWRKDLDLAREQAGIERVRFHGIFADELGVWTFGAEPNWQNVDAVYDGLLDRGMQPFVELSFMPKKLASGANKFGIYGGNVTPPTSLDDWAAFIGLFVRHLIERYGAAEVRQWYFEVWNEPNLPPFWSGTQQQYFDLYKATAQAVKAVDPALRVGGPSTSSAAWIPEFLTYCAANAAPVDFVTTHAYAGDNQKKLFGEAGKYKQNDVIPAVVARARAQIDETPFKGVELWLSEWSSDSPAMIAHVITNCLPHCHAVAHWAMSNDFEEIVFPTFILKEGDGGWGMRAQRGIAKPAFNTYRLLHRLGQRRLESSGPALASKTAAGAAVLVWNLADVTQASGIPGASVKRDVIGQPKTLRVSLKGARPGQTVKVSFVDQTRGSAMPAFRAMGSPKYPTRTQLAQLRNAAELAPPSTMKLDRQGQILLNLPPEGVALIELG